LAVLYRRIVLVELLLPREANVNLGEPGCRPLDVARRRPVKELEQLLLAHGAVDARATTNSEHNNESREHISDLTSS
jgi:hypothetical protein